MDMNKLVMQAQQMQRKIEKKQKELENSEFLFESNSGAVKIKMKGNKEIVSLDINKDLIDPSEKEMLEDIIIVAINNAMASIQEEMDKLIASFGKNIKMPGVF